MQRYKDKVVIVTGAGQGLGAGIAKAYAVEGAKVMLFGRTEAKVKKVAEGIERDGGHAFPVSCDISDYKNVTEAVDTVIEKYGKIDILINNAAVQQTRAFLDLDIDEWDWQIKNNLYGTFYMCKAVVKHMVQEKYGKIINISSSAAKYFFPGFAAYSASKGGITSFSNVLSEEVKDYGINVNSIYLGLTNTEAVRNRAGVDPAVDIPLEEMMQVEEVAKTILYLTSEDGKYFIGSAIDMFGKKY